MSGNKKGEKKNQHRLVNWEMTTSLLLVAVKKRQTQSQDVSREVFSRKDQVARESFHLENCMLFYSLIF